MSGMTAHPTGAWQGLFRIEDAVERHLWHKFSPDKEGMRGFEAVNHAWEANFTAANPSCPPLVRGGTERQLLAHHDDGIHAIVLGSGGFSPFLKEARPPGVRYNESVVPYGA
jgi:hypothetical protein